MIIGVELKMWRHSLTICPRRLWAVPALACRSVQCAESQKHNDLAGDHAHHAARDSDPQRCAEECWDRTASDAAND